MKAATENEQQLKTTKVSAAPKAENIYKSFWCKKIRARKHLAFQKEYRL